MATDKYRVKEEKMQTILQETKFIMNKYNIKANKNLGQNFLISQETVNHIIESSKIGKQDLIIEIGPGLGTLTKELLERAGKVICIELDPKMITILKDRFSLYNNFEIIHEDVLKVDLQQIIQKEKQNEDIKQAKIVANLPYYITTPIIMKLLEEKLELETITVMVQKEVADRLTAIPGGKNTGAITYSVYYYAEANEVAEVDKNSFIPAPEVTSEVIQFKIRKQPPIQVSSEKDMFKIIKNAFTQRRKTLLNALTNTHIFESKEQGLRIFQDLNLKENVRAEELSLEDFAKITEKLL